MSARPTIWQRLASPFRQFGPLAGPLYLVDRGLRALSPDVGLYVYELMEQPIATHALLPARRLEHIRYHLLQQDDREIELMPARPEVKISRFEQNAKCLGVYRNDELIGYLWYCFGLYREDEVRCDYMLPPGTASVFDFDLYIFPKHRKGSSFPALWHCANRHFLEQGVASTFSRLTRFNIASRRAHQRLGALRVGVALFLRLGTVELMLSTLSPFLSLSAHDSKRPRLKLKRRKTSQ